MRLLVGAVLAFGLGACGNASEVESLRAEVAALEESLARSTRASDSLTERVESALQALAVANQEVQALTVERLHTEQQITSLLQKQIDQQEAARAEEERLRFQRDYRECTDRSEARAGRVPIGGTMSDISRWNQTVRLYTNLCMAERGHPGIL